MMLKNITYTILVDEASMTGNGRWRGMIVGKNIVIPSNNYGKNKSISWWKTATYAINSIWLQQK